MYIFLYVEEERTLTHSLQEDDGPVVPQSLSPVALRAGPMDTFPSYTIFHEKF